MNDTDLVRVLIMAGAVVFISGLVIRSQEEMIDAQHDLLREVARDNMALRFQLHNKEVEEDA